MPLDELVLTEPDLGPDALALLEPGAAVLRRTTPGGAGPASVAAQLGDGRAPASTSRRAGSTRLSAATLPRSFYARDSRELAPLLLNKLLVRDDPATGARSRRASSRWRRTAGRDDPGSHASAA